MEINEVQTKLKEMLNKVAYPRVGTIVGLQEEIGKLSKAILDREIYNKNDSTGNLGNCCADVMFSLLDVCNSYDINLQSVLEDKITTTSSKVEMWEKEHGETLRFKRGKFDE